jgi:phospholipase/carboxylesterase
MMPPAKLRSRTVRHGSLDGVQIDAGNDPRVLVVTLHGFGAPGDDLVPIHSEWVRVLGEQAAQVRFFFPAAPLSLEEMGMPDGRAWWPLNMAKLMEAVEARDISDLRGHEPPGLQAANSQLTAAIEAMLEEANLGVDRLILGGFSQGAMLAVDVALRGLSEPPRGLFLYSGTLICEPQWTSAATRLIQTTTIQSHGSFDPILPFEGAEALYEMFKVAGVPVNFIPFQGPHTLTLAALDATADLMLEVLES